MAEKRTPMAWQHRDMNYHQGGYQDRYALEMGQMRPGPPSTSDRLSHRTDKSWRTQKDSVTAYPNGQQNYRPTYSNGRATTRTHSPSSSSTTSSSTEETDQEALRSQAGHMAQPQPLYGYGPYYPGPGSGYVGYPPSVSQGYPGTLKSTKSVPALAMNTFDGEPCPVHGTGPMSLQGPPPLMMPLHSGGPPMMMPHPSGHPGGPMMMPPNGPMMPPNGGPMMPPPRRAASIYDMRVMSPPPPNPIYGTLPIRPPGDRRSMVGGPPGIPPQLLPPMARPRPLVVSEDGTAEPLPVRSPPTDKVGALMSSKHDSGEVKQRICSKGGVCVAWIVIGVVAVGLVSALLLIFIL